MRSIIVLGLTGLLCIFSQSSLFALQPKNQPQAYANRALQQIAYAAADSLEYNITSDVDRTLPMVTSSVVQENDFTATSALGRQLGELIGSRLAQHGYNITDLRLRKDSLLISPGKGELALSRDRQHIENDTEIQAIIIGTYKCLENKVLASCKIIKTRDHSILAAHDFSFRLDNQLRDMCTADKVQPRKLSQDEQVHGRQDMRPLATGTIILDPSKSTDAKLIQSQLAEQGLYLDNIDGIWGKNSKIALEKFKIRHQLPDPEKWDFRTQVKLFSNALQ